MACGIPVIVFEGSALPSVIKAPVGGIVVPAKNSLALANAIDFLLINEIERLKISVQARALVLSKYSDELYMNRHIEVYQNAINNHALKNKKG
jgi:glycosyltransferase involved in cell wall biosynthesis